ncbi:MAG: type II secretion system minor pseudopilin GspH [Pseudomonadaceae bacterium]|nr:type II secretion system minor pseudopilin GspH [Pseudomonadaceae bacterium]
MVTQIAVARSRGFTLIELLVVVVIVGVLAGTLLLNATNRGTQYRLDADAQRLLQVIETARAQALQRNREWGVVVDEAGYSFAELSDTDGWQVVADRVFAKQQLPDLELRLEVEGRQAKLIESVSQRARPVTDSQAEGEEAEAALTPSIVLFSSGEMTPFELELFPGDALQTNFLISDGLNLRLARTNEPLDLQLDFDL